MTDLIAFLRARLDEDERAARAAMHSTMRPDGDDRWERSGVRVHAFDNGRSERYESVSVTTHGVERWARILVAGDLDGDTAAHIARQDPARVLREVAAKDAVMRLLVVGDDEHATDSAHGYQEGVAQALEALAATWSDHPDYDPTWSAT